MNEYQAAEFRCEGCGATFAEYVNGCPKCSEDGMHFSVSMSMSKEQLDDLYFEIQRRLSGIEPLVGPNYKLTLVVRYSGEKPLDADIVLTTDDFDKVIETINNLRNREPVYAPKGTSVLPNKVGGEHGVYLGR